MIDFKLIKIKGQTDRQTDKHTSNLFLFYLFGWLLSQNYLNQTRQVLFQPNNISQFTFLNSLEAENRKYKVKVYYYYSWFKQHSSICLQENFLETTTSTSLEINKFLHFFIDQSKNKFLEILWQEESSKYFYPIKVNRQFKHTQELLTKDVLLEATWQNVIQHLATNQYKELMPWTVQWLS